MKGMSEQSKRYRAGLAAMVMLLSVAACAPATEYVRPSMTAAQRDADEKACLDEAQSHALEESFSSHPLYPPLLDTMYVDEGGADGGGRNVSFTRRSARVYELTKYCMEQRGYKLVAAGK